MDESEDATVYKVVVNDEGQYLIWRADQDLPPGWKDGGRAGSKKDCLDHIKQVWTDMRPASVRKQMEARNFPEPV